MDKNIHRWHVGKFWLDVREDMVKKEIDRKRKKEQRRFLKLLQIQHRNKLLEIEKLFGAGKCPL